MEFNFRSVDHRPSPPSPIFHNPVNSIPSMSHNSSALSRPIPTPMWSPNSSRDRIMREYERERMMLGEIARRREVELEVRWEIIYLEQEMAARRAGFAFDDRFGSMPYVPSPPHSMWFDSNAGYVPMPMSMQPYSYFDNRSGFYPSPPPLPLAPRDVAARLNASPDPNKNKLIVLAKPTPNVSWKHKKAVEPSLALATKDPHPFGLKEKPKDEWSCALCQVSALSEKVLNEHLMGKKHKAKEEILKNQNASKNPKYTHVLKKNRHDASNSEPKDRVIGESCKENEMENVSSEEKMAAGDGKSNVELVPEEDKVAGHLNTAELDVAHHTTGASELKKKKKKENFTFWCEMCQVGADSSLVMEGHKNGKKHRVNLQKHDKSDEAVGPTHISPEAKEEGQSLMKYEMGFVLNIDKIAMEVFGSNEEIMSEQDKVAGDLKNTDGPEATQQEERASEQKRNQFPFWCEMCQVGVDSSLVMEDHKKGKKHRVNLKKHEKSDEAEVSAHISQETREGELLIKYEMGDVLNIENFMEDFKSNEKIMPKQDKVAGDLRNADGSEVTREAERASEQKRDRFPFWCEMCQVGADSSLVMEDHKKGKKHRVNLKKHDKSDEAEGSTHISLGDREEGESLIKYEMGDALNIDKIAMEDFESNEKVMPDRDKIAGDLKNTDGSHATEQADKVSEQKDRFPFWCEMCRVGTHSALMMEEHKGGRRHMAKLKKYDESDAAVGPTHISPEVIVPKTA